jgi:hypothetical protein
VQQLEIKEFSLNVTNFVCSFLAHKHFLLVGVIRAKKNYLKGFPMGQSSESSVLDRRI